MRLPPRWVRRVVLAPLIVGLTLLMVAFAPLTLVLAAFVSRYVPGRWRALRLIWFAYVWLVFESIAVVAMFVMWIASGFGWKIRSPAFENGHYRLMAWFLRRIVGSARRTFGLETVADVPVLQNVGRPILVLARHAGPGDSLLLVDGLMNGFQRHPRIVLKETLQWDPAIDILLNRVPSRFISTRHKPGEAAVTAIGELAATLGAKDALVIFPEGGNFTPARWERAIDKLKAMGLEQYAERAASMQKLLPPKPAGVLAAVAQAPDAAIVLVGHAGLEQMDTVADVWAGMRMDIAVRTRTWTYPVSELPKGRAHLETWLYDRWEAMNDWLESVPPPVPIANESLVRRKGKAAAEVIDQTYRSWRNDRTIRLGAGLAYYTLFGVVPFFTLAIYIAGFAFSQQEIQAFVAESLVRLLGEAEAAALGDYLGSTLSTTSSNGSLGLIGIGTLVFASSLVLAALQDALNLIFGIPVESGLRVSVQRRMWLFVLVLGFATVVLASLILNTVIAALASLFRLDALVVLGPIEALLGRSVSLLLIAALLTLLYRRLPRTRVAWRPAVSGAVASVVAGAVAIAAVRLYLARFATSSIQGAAGALALILTLVYVLSQVLLAGAQLVKVLNDRTSEG